jgi:sporulation protein YlmC with PRC-barrel domain
MREGSYAEIKKGMRVVGRDGETIGEVTRVIVDDGSGIFHGLAVRPNLFTHDLELPGERVARLHDGVVYVEAVQDELKPYEDPETRHHLAAEQYGEANR